MTDTKGIENKIVLFTNEKGDVELRADVEKDTLWATQEQIANLFQITRTVVTKHIRNIINDKELDKAAVCAKFAHTAEDGKSYLTYFYNLDIILAVGYRTSSTAAIKFRQWATGVLREYLTKGYSLNKYSLENSEEKFDDLHEAIAFIESKKDGEEVRGKMTIKLTKNLIR
jgi:hypothetical protein